MTLPPAPVPAEPRPDGCILVVDDDLQMCRTIADMARWAGFEARHTTDPGAIESLIDDELVAITLDLSMPHVDGIQVLRNLARQRVAAKVILLSGVDESILHTAINLGRAEGLNMAGSLRKPVRAADLVDLLRKEIRPPGTAAARTALPQPSAQELRAGIAQGQMVIRLQPQVDLVGGGLVGAEVLVRWQHPTRGLLYPDSFLPAIEAHGLGLALTETVLEQALTLCTQHPGVCDRLPRLSVNLPPQALSDLGFPDRVAARLAHHGLDASRLAFELTETSFAREPVSALDILSRLRLKGVELSIDDFGVGYSSLEQLRQLPFNEIKIDKQFVNELGQTARSTAIVKGTISMAKDLGLRVLAEGVETVEVWRLLQALRCDLAQGYLITRPLPAQALTAWLPGWQAPDAALPLA
jgi:EAL domain-containing protein (putative c-di-GMP-specific phosphodiesterase class I)/FixJ family two-component response regulator